MSFIVWLLVVAHHVWCDEPLVMKRQIYFSDPLHRISVSLNGATQAATQLHTLLVFGDVGEGRNRTTDHYHNALILSPAKLQRFSKITAHSDFAPHRYISVIAKGHTFQLQYDLAHYAEQGIFGSGTPKYDAILRLDFLSSLWNEFDTLLFEKSQVSLSLGAADDDDRPQRQDYAGFYRLPCEHNHWHHCRVDLRRALLNGEPVQGADALIVDLDAPHNLLPHDLFMRWKFEGMKELEFSMDTDRPLVRLNRKFQYRLNENSDKVVLGIDVVRYFQRVEYSLHRHRVVVWYSRLYADCDTYETHKQLVFWLISLVLTCISCWFCSPTYDVLRAVVKRRPTADYPYQLVIVDLVTLTLAPILWIVVFVAGDEWSNAFAGYSHCVVLQRQLLIFSLGLYSFLLLALLMLGTRDLTWQTARHYYHHFRSYFTSRGVDRAMVDREADPVSVKMVLFRNLAGHTLQVTNFMLIVNYVSEELPLYTIPLIVASLSLMFYYVKTLYSGAVYVARNGGPRQEPLFTALGLLSAAVFIVYSVFATQVHYTDFFGQLNAVFHQYDVHTFSVEFQCFILLVALLCVYIPLVRYVRKHQRKALKKSV